jgi:predicted amidohydrolase
VIAEAGEEPGHIMAELDAGEVREARRKIPSLYNARSYARP